MIMDIDKRIAERRKLPQRQKSNKKKFNDIAKGIKS